MTEVAELQAGLDLAAAEELFDSLPAVTIDEMIGRWHGSEVPTGHQMDGLLAASGWYGKEFVDADHVHPLLFGEPESLFAVNPKLMPMGWMVQNGQKIPRKMPPGGDQVLRLGRTRKHRARIRVVEYRGTSSAAMVYDDLPIIDHFRQLGPDTLLGAMDVRGSERPYFFLLERD